MPTFADLFAGIGGFRLGLERAGWECAWANDIDRWACSVYRRHWKVIAQCDIRSVDPDTMPDFDVLCAGFPCQPFSYAGKRLGFADERGTLFSEVVRIARRKKPKIILLENVKGLLSAQGGECFAEVLRSLHEMGYDAEWAVLDSQDFGVPQRRERVFVVGYPRGSARGSVLAELEPGQVAAEAAV